MLVRLLYASRPVAPLTTAVVDSILAQSRAHNPRLGITGVLCYSQDLFLQVLEGGRDEVCELYNTIVRDDRHDHVRILCYEEIAERLNELMIVGPITVRSACSHHFCPIMGRLWIGLMPNEHSNLIGLSKYARLAEWVMSRPQIQEEAITQMAELLMRKVSPDGLAVVMEADHFCMHWRGVKDSETKMINSVMRGSFLKDATLRREFLSLINLKA